MNKPMTNLIRALSFVLLGTLAGSYVWAQDPVSSEPTESTVSPAPGVHAEDDGHDHGAPSDESLDVPENEQKQELGGEFTLLPVDLGKPAKGLEDRALKSFAEIAVLHDGRIKPLETMARHLLLQWSGHEGYDGKSALSVLAQIIFAPEKTGDLKLFRIDNPEVAEALKIKPDKKRRYSYRELEPSLTKLQELSTSADSVEEAKRNVVEKEVLRTFGNIATYLNLTRSMQFALPSSWLTVRMPETRHVLNLPNQAEGGPTVSFWELMERAPVMAQILDGINRNRSGEFSPVENEVVRLSRAMYLQSQTGMTSLLKIVPDPDKPGTWLSPSEVVANPDMLKTLNAEISDLAGMTQAYRGGEASEFQTHALAYNAAVIRQAPEVMERTSFSLENLKNRIDPLFIATVLFWISMFTGFLFFLFVSSRTASRWIYGITWVFAGSALIFLIASIVARIIIMRRPPVTSLFETFPFVASISILVALFLERRSRQGVALLSATMLGTLLLSIANRYAADGDTMQMLVAVLNSNFWLSTHVVCISIGYSACVLAGAIAHIRLVRGAWTPVPTPQTRTSLREIDRMVYGTLCFGLLFSFIGTVLGGIWADQSWGRFWGWDPKENGALLIVIWCAILLHAKQWGVVREIGLAVGAVLGAIIVSLAWQGVNLLNVGLHSYGFTTGAVVKLFTYIGAEILFLLIIWVVTMVRKRKKTTPV